MTSLPDLQSNINDLHAILDRYNARDAEMRASHARLLNALRAVLAVGEFHAGPRTRRVVDMARAAVLCAPDGFAQKHQLAQ